MSYVVRTEEDMTFYYFKDGKLCKRIRKADGLSPEYDIMTGIMPDFSLSVAPSGERLIFCRLTKGDIMLIKDGRKGTSGRIILKNTEKSFRGSIAFDALVEKNGISLIYSIPSGHMGENNIYMQRLSREKTGPRLIDTSYGRDYGFCTCHIDGGLRTLFYYKNRRENIFGYRELLGDEWGKYNSVFTSAAYFTDFSRHADKEGLYFLAVINNLFGSRILFRTRTNEGFSAVRVVADMNSINTPLVFLFRGKAYIFFRSGSTPYMAVGDERPVRFGGKLCSRLMKGRYIDSGSRSGIRASEILLDRDKPWDVQLFDEIDENFHKYGSPAKGGEDTAVPRGRDYSFKDFFGKKGSELL